MDAWNTLVAELSSALGVVADLRVSTSAILLALIAYAAWRVLGRRRGRPDARSAGTTASPLERTSVAPLSDPSTDRATLGGLADALPLERLRGLGSHAAAAGFRVRWDRTALALVGALALVAFVVTGVCAVAGLPTAGAAAWALILALGSVATLRVLAVRDQERRAAARHASAEDAVIETAKEDDAAPVADPERDRRTFETLLALDEDEAPEDADVEEVAPAVPAATPAPAARVERAVVIPPLPRPTYLDAPEVARPMPEPYVAETVTASSTRLKDAADPDRLEHVRADAEQDIAALDLDSVLARRRAS